MTDLEILNISKSDLPVKKRITFSENLNGLSLHKTIDRKIFHQYVQYYSNLGTTDRASTIKAWSKVCNTIKCIANPKFNQIPVLVVETTEIKEVETQTV